MQEVVMKSYDIKDKRNIAFVGHTGTGKTSFLETMLFNLGLTKRIGKVEDGNTVSDFLEEEQKKHVSMSTSSILFDWNGTRMNVLDTPGFPDFIAEVITSTRVVDNVVCFINATAGVEVQTEKAWQVIKSYKKPIMIFMNKLDRENTDYKKTLEEVSSNFENDRFVPVFYPLGREDNLKGVVNIITDEAFVYENGKATKTEIPQEVKDQIEEMKTKAIEAVVEVDDDLTMKYLEGEDISNEELDKAFKEGYAKGDLIPVFCGSVEKNIGLDTIFDYLTAIGITPLRSELDLEDDSVLKYNNSDFYGLVFKTIIDSNVGRMNYMRVYSGKLPSGGSAYNLNTGIQEKLGHLYMMNGKDRIEVNEATAGDIITVVKLKETLTGHTLSSNKDGIKAKPFVYPEPMFSYAVEPKSKDDVDKINNGLARLSEMDPTFVAKYNTETQEMVISGMGDIQLKAMIDRLKNNFKTEVTLSTPKIPYKETIKKKAVGEHKHKKQTGGHGQYGHCIIEIMPLKRGEGYAFEDKIFGGAIPKNYIPSVEKGVIEAMKAGVVAGFPVVDVKVDLIDGSYHDVDSSDLSFQLAGIQAFKKAMASAQPVLLEPVMYLEITVPEANMGDVMGDINGRRGRILGMEALPGNKQLLKAEMPLVEVYNFGAQLNSLTSGRGHFVMKFSTYSEVPSNIAQDIIKSKKAEEENS
jgi:elongation factor G